MPGESDAVPCFVKVWDYLSLVGLTECRNFEWAVEQGFLIAQFVFACILTRNPVGFGWGSGRFRSLFLSGKDKLAGG